VFYSHRKALGVALATALTLAATAVPGALAQPINPHGPDARDAANRTQPPTDLRSPDARDAAASPQIVVSGPPTWPANPQPVTRPAVIVSASNSGLDWPSAGIGAGAVIGAFAIALAALAGLRHRRLARPGSPTVGA
jgi:hypothetical protein